MSPKQIASSIIRVSRFIIGRQWRRYKFFLRWKDVEVFSMDSPTLIFTCSNTHLYNTKYKNWISVGESFNPNCPVTLFEYKLKEVGFWYFVKQTGIAGIKKLANDICDEDIFTLKSGDIEGYVRNQEPFAFRSYRIKNIVQMLEGTVLVNNYCDD